MAGKKKPFVPMLISFDKEGFERAEREEIDSLRRRIQKRNRLEQRIVAGDKIHTRRAELGGDRFVKGVEFSALFWG